MAKFHSEVNGVDVTLKTMGRFKSAVQRRIVRNALTKAARIIAKEVKQRAPKESGLLKKSIGQVVRTYRGTNKTIAVIGPRRGFKATVMRKKPFGGEDGLARDYPVLSDPVKYAHLVEFGTEPHAMGGGSDLKTKKGDAGKQSGAGHPGAKARPFMRPGFDASKNAAQKAFQDDVAAGMAREANKLRAKGGK